MTISIWRYAHLALALIASIFILIASFTGIILATEPIVNQSKSLKVVDFDSVILSETVTALKEKYSEVLTLTVDNNDFVQVEVIDSEGDNSVFYINPKTAEKIGDTFKRSDVFTFSQTLHRSLFLGKVGRIVMAVTSFLLMLIAFTGIFLIIRKQKSWKHFFQHFVKDSFFAYYHTVLGRWLLLPILVIAFTGFYLSLDVFSLLPKSEEVQGVEKEIFEVVSENKTADFSVFNVPLSQVRKVEFPLFEDEEEYYRIGLIDKSLVVNQFTGEVVSQTDFLFSEVMLHYSLILHTGQGTLIWSLVLLCSCIGILFFVYSGFAITLKRRKSRIENRFNKDECTHIILVGSEGGTTLGFAKLVHNELIRKGVKSFLAEMNSFSRYKKMQHLVVMTSTYGDGSEPINATNFFKLWKEQQPDVPFSYSVVGFGSLAYPNFCRFAYQVNDFLGKTSVGTPFLDIYTVNNQSFESFSAWVNAWASKQNFALHLSSEMIPKKKYQQRTFKVVDKTTIECDETFLIQLQSAKRLSVESGDLLVIIPNTDKRPRMYSIGKTEQGNILLSVKRHTEGIVSNYLNSLKSGDILEAAIQKNSSFHFPKKASEVVCIATGTGIAPFLGMIECNCKQIPLTLIWGGRTSKSFSLYNDFINRKLSEKKLTNLHLALSRSEHKQYVQDIVKNQADFFVRLLKNKGVIMICGSVAMQKCVMKELDDICRQDLGEPLSYYQNRKQILMDCY